MGEYENFRASAQHRGPLREFVVNALEGEGAKIIYASPEDGAPSRVTRDEVRAWFAARATRSVR